MIIELTLEKLLKMKRFGLDWDCYQTAANKVSEELEEVREAIKENDPAHLKEELGDLILTAIDLARHLGHDPSEALDISLSKLSSRFEHFKRLVNEKDLNAKEMSFEDRLCVWKEAKKAA